MMQPKPIAAAREDLNEEPSAKSKRRIPQGMRRSVFSYQLPATSY
jgi:hypothetical protein